MRLVIHVDLDAFYAQVEHQRLQIPPQQPLAVRQWSRVIAVNYPARRAGITRHCTAQECKLKCPSLSLVHVATMSVLDDTPGTIRLHGPDDMDGVDSRTCKASLAPYRKASRDIFGAVKAFFQHHHQQVVIERASVDEAFIEIPPDFARHYDAPSFIGHPIVRGKEDNSMDDSMGNSMDNCMDNSMGDSIHDSMDNSMDDSMDEQSRLIQRGTVIARDLRLAIKTQLGYTMSAGIAKNKTLAKLASGKVKPDNQTYVLDSHITPLMQTTPFSRIRFLGGKLGNSLKEDDGDDDDLNDFGEDHREGGGMLGAADHHAVHEQTAFELQSKSLEELQRRVGESARWVYNVIRGEDRSPVIDRSLVKSFMSVKQLRPPLCDTQLLHRWLRLLCSELAGRMQDEYETAKRWPSTITLHWRHPAATTRSKAHGLGDINEASAGGLYDHVCKQLLSACLKTHQPLPLKMIALSVSRFKPFQQRSDTMDKYVRSGESGPVFAFQKRPAPPPSAPARWHCPRCATWYELHQLDRIQEHQDHHLAMDLAKQM